MPSIKMLPKQPSQKYLIIRQSLKLTYSGHLLNVNCSFGDNLRFFYLKLIFNSFFIFIMLNKHWMSRPNTDGYKPYPLSWE